MASQGDPQGGQVSRGGTEGKNNWGPCLQDPGPHPWPWAEAPLPDPPGLLQAELSHITEGAEARLGEVVPVALQADGREPGLRGVQRWKVQGYRIQQGLGRSGREGQAGHSLLFILVPSAQFPLWVCINPPWLSRALTPNSRPVPGAPASLQSVWLADHLVKCGHQLVKVRSLGTILLPSVQHKQVQSRRTAWRRGQPEFLLYCI